MASIEIKDGILHVERFGEHVRTELPTGGRVEIDTHEDHVDVEIRDRIGVTHRRFRLPRAPST